jgi:hypothetical protein
MGGWDLVETTVKVRAEYRHIGGVGRAKWRVVRDLRKLREVFGHDVVEIQSWEPMAFGGVAHFRFTVPGRVHEKALSEVLTDALKGSVWQVRWQAWTQETVVGRAGE